MLRVQAWVDTDKVRVVAVDASSTTMRTPTVTIGGVQADTNFEGLAPGYPGVYQVNPLISTTILPAPAVPLTLSIDGGVVEMRRAAHPDTRFRP